jgi:hypothetical protein
MAEVFSTTTNAVVQSPILSGGYFAGIDRSLVDGRGLVNLWGGGPLSRQFQSSTTIGQVANDTYNLEQLISIVAQSSGTNTINYSFEGLIGPQGIPGPPGPTQLVFAKDIEGNIINAPTRVLDDGAVPGTVQNVSATAMLKAVMLEWDSNTELDIDHYIVYRNTVDDSGTASAILISYATLCVDGGRVAGTPYYYWVKAVDYLGNTSASFSTVATATPGSVDDDVVQIDGSKILLSGTTYLSNWRHGSDLTKIDGGDIFANSITLTGLASSVTNRMPTIFLQASVPTSNIAGDYWFDTDDDNKLYRADSAGADQITAGEWELVDLPQGVTTFRQSAVPTAEHAGDIWIDTDDGKMYRATNVGDDQITAGEWELYDAAEATGWTHASDTTKIDGGVIYTDSIIADSIAANTITYNELRQAAGSEAVDTGCIRDDATTIYDAVTTAGSISCTGSSWTTVATVSSFPSEGGIITISGSAYGNNASYAMKTGIFAGANLIVESDYSVPSGGKYFPITTVDVQGAGSVTYYLKVYTGGTFSVSNRHLTVMEGTGK